jgi:pimeloyl-ACP methyl ester carboxylesterase
VATTTLTVPDATIRYDRRGAGPLLVLLPGGSGDAGVFGPLADRLAVDRTVVSVYSRVASHDPELPPLGEQHPAVHADDVSRLLTHLGDESATVFGSSSGAITAIELLHRHPDQVTSVIAHEPPSVSVLPDAQRHRAMLESVRATAREKDTTAAMSLLMAGLTAEGPTEGRPRLRHHGDWRDGYANTPAEPLAPELAEVLPRLSRLQPAFLVDILVPFAGHAWDTAALQPVADRLFPAAGVDSQGELPYRAAASLAARLDVPMTELPGGHLGPLERPAMFAAALTALIDNRGTTRI